MSFLALKINLKILHFFVCLCDDEMMILAEFYLHLRYGERKKRFRYMQFALKKGERYREIEKQEERKIATNRLRIIENEYVFAN